MKKLFFLPILAFVVFAFTHVSNTYYVDTTASNIVWIGEKVTGKHTGNVKLKSGTLQMDNDKLVGGSFEIDMTTISCTDLEGGMADKLVSHLKSEDFFGVDKYPTALFTITRAIPQDTKGNYKIIGNLTIKEITNPIVFKANVANNGGKISATGDIVVDRSLYNVRFGSGSFFDNLGDKTIYDEFMLKVSLVTK
ncbi:YceI family protein [Sphingobacteriales bacterium UPWRP_1]|nr:lipid-binding protein [Sphingobacteriales bacterium TSM_CSM]PSJ75674.1 YceI family protein [Sphingobacteriales bacterium UPWRP_1]